MNYALLFDDDVKTWKKSWSQLYKREGPSGLMYLTYNINELNLGEYADDWFFGDKKRIDSSRSKMYIDDKLEKINKSVDKNYNELNERIIELEENMKNRYNQVPYLSNTDYNPTTI